MFDWLWELSGNNIAAATEIPYCLVTAKLLCAVAAGSIIGFERAYHGRPAGVRTYTLICLASAALLQAVLHLPIWLPKVVPQIYRVDTTRVIFATVEGIAFICVGVIFRQGLTFRGLTTAAAIWFTAMVGVLFGIGLFYIGGIAVIAILLLLIVFYRIERSWSQRRYARCNVVFARDGGITRERFFKLLAEHQLETFGKINHQLINGGRDFEVGLTIRSRIPNAFPRFIESLRQQAEYKSYNIRFVNH